MVRLPRREADKSRRPSSEGTGMSLLQVDTPRIEHPVDTIERLAAHNQWDFDRDDEDEISIAVEGSWTDYNIAFTWLADLEALHFACAFDLKVPSARRGELASLIGRINEQMWIGHFELWPNDGLILFRHALLLAGGAEVNGHQCQTVLASAVGACERYYPAFQFVLWAGKSSGEAMQAVLFETTGEA
jgi:hypothetical protein